MSMNSSLVANKIDTFIRLFLYILIFWLPYSSAVVESCVIACVILWMVKRSILLTGQIKQEDTLSRKLSGFLRGIKPESSFLNKPIVFFLLACILSVTASAFFRQSLHNFFTKTLEWFVVYFLVIEVFKDKKHIYIALGVFLFTAFSTIIDSLVQFHLTYKDIFSGQVIEPGGRATAGFKTSNGLGGYLALLVPGLSAYLLLGKQSFRTRLITLLILTLAVWSLIITFSRGAWVGAFLGGMFLLFFILSPKKKVNMYFSLGLLWATVFLCIAFLLFLANSSGQEFFGRYETIRWRLGIWSISMEMIKDKLFFGHGINTFMRIFQAYRDNSHGPTYAHNCYIQLAAETGIVGLFCFLAIMVMLFHRSLENIRSYFAKDQNLGVLALSLLSGVFAFLVHSFFDTHFYSLQLSVYLWFMIGTLVAICKMPDVSEVHSGKLFN